MNRFYKNFRYAHQVGKKKGVLCFTAFSQLKVDSEFLVDASGGKRCIFI